MEWGPDLPPGPYCGSNNLCCVNRDDNCTHDIILKDSEGRTSIHKCYCDEFCYRENGHDDCCFDYPTVCNKTGPPVPTTEAPPETTTIVTTTTAAPANFTDCISCDDQDEECSNYRCMIQDSIIEKINNDASLGWTAANYSQFAGKKLKDGLIYKLGTFERRPDLSNFGAMPYDKDEYETEFNVKKRWPHLITPIVDQGWCGSDWAVSLASIASDRFAIQSKGAEKVRLSPQTLLSCSYQEQQGCKGGHVDVAWRFAENHGLVDEDCFPYKAHKTPCPLEPQGNLVTDKCTPASPGRTERYKVGPIYRLAKEKDIMYDILHSGPIQAMMEVYQDFFHYKGGVYRHSRYGDQTMKKYHTVRVVGWGEENGLKYWVVANSWGTQWGEDGYFRIVRNVNECDIESFMLSFIPKVRTAS